MLKVLHVVSRLGYGGIERYLLSLVGSLDREEFACDVACVGHRALTSDPLVGAMRDAGAGVWFLPMPLYPSPKLATFRAEVMSRKYDLVHCHLADGSGLIAAALAGSGVPFIAGYHHANGHESRPLVDAILRVYRFWLTAARTPLSGCSSYAMTSHFGSEADLPGHALYYGIDLDRFTVADPSTRARAREALGISRDRFVVSHVGRFVPEKNHALILDTAALATQRVPELLFVLAGDGPLRQSIEQQARRRGLGASILFTGATSAPEMVLYASDLFFLPSRTEGFGLALLEAHACGLPVVATNLPAYREFAAGWPGVFLEDAEPLALAERIMAVYRERDGAKDAAGEAHDAIALKFSNAAAAARWRSLAFEVAGRRARA